ncbi:MAG: LytR/AlgR family response regulator transcription factor [Bacteroidota bacterium]
MITVGIIDDEPRVADGLRKIIEKYLYRKTRVLFVCHSVKDAVARINIYKPHLIFLDVEMPGENGFELFRYFDDPDFKVVITTAYKEYAINAIKHSALDYILKPVNHTELIELFAKIEKQAKNTKLKFQVESLVANLNHSNGILTKIAFPTHSGIEYIKVNNIVYCQAENTYSTIHTCLNESIVVSKTLKAVEELLPPNLFVRIHKSYLVNVNYIKSYTRAGAQGVILENGDFLPVASGKSRDVITLLKNE